MISIEQLNGEIAVLEEEVPTHVIMQKLANLYTVRDHIGISKTDAQRINTLPNLGTGSEFSQKIYGKEGLPVMMKVEDLVQTISVLNPRLYEHFMEQL